MMNTIIYGDCLDVMKNIDDNYIDLIYCDILYGTGKNFGDYQDLKCDRKVIEEHYIPRIKEMYRVLKETGSIYLQMDWRINHWIRLILDNVFGYDNFVNEIIWKRSANTSSIGKIWKRAHDCIFYYSKSYTYTFNFQRKELSESSIKIYSKEDDYGKYRLVPLLVSGKRNGKTGEIWKDIDPNKLGKNGMHWVTKPEKLNEYEKKDLIEWSKDGIPGLKYYLKDNPGVVVSDIWDDINLITSTGNQSLNYPTQKPIKLLERIIKASSNEGDLVADFYMGSGTTCVVAKELNRKYIGCDISKKAIEITNKRLNKANHKKELEAEKNR